MNSSLELSLHDQDIITKEGAMLNFTNKIHREPQEEIVEDNRQNANNTNLFDINYSSAVREFGTELGSLHAQLGAFKLQFVELEKARLAVEEKRRILELRKAELRECELRALESERAILRRLESENAELAKLELEKVQLEKEIEIKQLEKEIEIKQLEKEKINNPVQAEQMVDRYKNNRLKNKGSLLAKNQIVSAKVPYNKIQTQIKTQTKVVSNKLNKVIAESLKVPTASNNKKQFSQVESRLTSEYKNQTNYNNPVKLFKSNFGKNSNNSFKTTFSSFESVLNNHVDNRTSQISTAKVQNWADSLRSGGISNKKAFGK